MMLQPEASPTLAGQLDLHAPSNPMDTDDVLAAYRRWASFYDVGFGLISGAARRKAVREVNGLEGGRVLEVGVGTGLSLPRYTREKRITGIDLSREMLDKARDRVARRGLANVDALLEMDGESMSFENASFDIAVAMFVASVVPNPRRLMSEMRRVVRPGGHLLFINHFAREDRGLIARIEQGMAEGSAALGWHPDFRYRALMTDADRGSAILSPAWPMGIFTLVKLPN